MTPLITMTGKSIHVLRLLYIASACLWHHDKQWAFSPVDAKYSSSISVQWMDFVSSFVESPICISRRNFLPHAQDNVLSSQVPSRTDSAPNCRAKTVSHAPNTHVLEESQGIRSLEVRQGGSHEDVFVYVPVSQTVPDCSDASSDFQMHPSSRQNTPHGLQSWHGSVANGSSPRRVTACLGNGARAFVCASRQNVSHSRF